jgi:osmoprotectant transport system permease protein
VNDNLKYRKLAGIIIPACLLLLYILYPPLQTAVLRLIFPGQPAYLHPRVSLLSMTITHLGITLLATLLSLVTGTALGIFVTRRAGKAFLSLVRHTNALLQSLPPSAMIILAYPLLGFGWKPTLLALFFYSLLPVAGNTIIGFQSVSEAVLDSADGLGMKEMERLRIVELPIAFPHILTGIRHAFILNLGTAAIGAVIGAGGLGSIIMSGLLSRNSALVFSGTLVITSTALISEKVFSLLAPRRGIIRT